MYKIYKSTKLNQQGLVSMLVVMIIMIVLSLLVLGFAQVTRREQRQTLDRQLNSQANYAAETGINDAQNYIKGQLASGASINSYTTCGSGGGVSNFSSTGVSNSVDGTNTTYTCTLINPSPTELIWQRIGTDSSIAFPFTPSAGNTGITFSWQDADAGATSYGACASSAAVLPLTSQFTWTCQAGALRIDITPVAGSYDRKNLVDSTQNFVLYPVQAGVGTSSIALSALGHGGIIPVSCTPSNTATHPRHCQVAISSASGSYFIRIQPLYLAANIQISPAVSGTTLTGAQAIIDVTGKANDILRRLQARISINPLESDVNTTFGYAIQSIDSICKRAAIVPNAAPPDPKVIKNDPTGGAGDLSCATP